MKYQAYYHVHLGYHVTVNAESEAEAKEKAEAMFGEADIVGKEADYIDSTLEYCEEAEEDE